MTGPIARRKYRSTEGATVRAATVLLSAALLATMSVPATGQAFPDVIPLPDGFQPEGIAIGGGPTAYAGSLADGDLVQVDLRTGAVDRFVDVEDRVAVGLGLDPSGGQVFVSGGPTGQAWVYDSTTGTEVAALALTESDTTFVNDVVVTRTDAWFTDSFAPVLYRVPLGADGIPTGAVETVELTGDFDFLEGDFNANGIEATPDGSSLLVMHSGAAELHRVDPASGETTAVDLDGFALTAGDGILLDGRRDLTVVRNRANTVTSVVLSPDLATGTVTDEVTDPDFDVPTTVAAHGSRQYVVNARFGIEEPETASYTLVRVGD